MSIRIGGSRIGPRVENARARRATRLAVVLAAALLVCAPATVILAQSTPQVAQAPKDREAQKEAAKGQSGKPEMLVEADELVYDKDHNTVSASGHAKVYYQGRVLQADKVTYYRDKKQVLAEGNAKLTDEQGNVYYGTVFELTDDFKSGFINSLLVETKDKTRFAAPHGERSEGETTTFESATYTACEPCKDDPTKPPLWQVRAKRIIDNHTEHKVYYEDAWLELYGWPVFYMPYFSAPDPSVRRQSGFLAPRFYGGSNIGFGMGVPFFWALAPDYDVTLTPSILTQQGVLGEVEWRQRLANGTYSIRVSGIDQLDPQAFPAPPYGANNLKLRGSVESQGKFFINEDWKYGWTIAGATDKFFFQNYKIRAPNITVFDYNGAREAISQAYLTGKGDRSWFDLRGFYFETLNGYDWQKQLPVAAPVFDYDRRFDVPSMIGGEFTVNANMQNIRRYAGDFADTVFRSDPLSPNYLNTYYFNTNNLPGSTYGNVYNACAIYNKTYCIVRGIPGDYTRGSIDLSWRRRIIDDLGEVWEPFAYFKGQLSYTNLDTTGYNNANIANFLSPDQSFGARTMPAIGLAYRFPFVATADWGTSVIEPIAQVITRPSESRIGHLANEDAQSLVFDDTTLFQWDKFSGYDRMEGGSRANAGLQYTLQAKNGGTYNVLVGESYQFAGTNSYAVGDLVNAGLESGLNTHRSDFVGRVQAAPFSWFSTTVRGRFDNEDFGAKRLEVNSTLLPFQAFDLFPDNKNFRSLTLSGTYAHIDAQPDIGRPFRQNALNLNASWNVWSDWTLNYGITFDLSHHDDPILTYVPSTGEPILHYSHGLWTPLSNVIYAQYKNDCCTFKAQYVTGYATSNYGARVKDETILLTLELRTLGAISYSSDVTGYYNQLDGINSGR
jgi:LPS-assembly protein